MKIEFDNGIVRGIPENESDLKMLYTASLSSIEEERGEDFTCESHSMVFQSLTGMLSHQRAFHGLKAKNSKKNRVFKNLISSDEADEIRAKMKELISFSGGIRKASSVTGIPRTTLQWIFYVKPGQKMRASMAEKLKNVLEERAF